MTFTGYAGETIPLQRYSRIEALRLELHYITRAKEPAATVVQNKFNEYGHKDKVTERRDKAAQTVLAAIKANGEMTANQMAAATGMKQHAAREALNCAVSKGLLHRDSRVQNNYRFRLPDSH